MKNEINILLAALLLAGACASSKDGFKDDSSVKEFKITARQFSFEPETIEVNKGDRVRLIVASLDIPHGIAITEYGINKRFSPGKPATIEFIADKEGNFSAYCSVACGRGHRNMKGRLIVK